MNWRLAIGSFSAGAALGFWGEVFMFSASFLFAIVFSIIAGIFLSWAGYDWLSRKLWPSRDKWWVISSYDDWVVSPQQNPQNALSSNRGQIWRSPLTQELGAWFEVDMGKPRTIARIEFLTDNSDIEKPKKWRMMFYGEDDNGLKHTLCHKYGEYNIFVRGRDIPNPIRWFRVEITEVAEDMKMDTNYAKQHDTTKVFWTISLIKLTEYRFNILGKRFCKHEL